MRKSHRHLEGPAYVEHGARFFREGGGRITKTRLAILKCLSEASRPIGPTDMVAWIQGESATDVDLATVYRTLESLEKNGLVHRVGTDGHFVACGHAACDSRLHLLTRCRLCGQTNEIDLPAEVMGAIAQLVTEKTRFRIEENLLQLSGCCEECALIV